MMIRAAHRLAAALALLLILTLPAAAQPPAPPSAAISAEEARHLAATLKDDAARERLIADLEALAAMHARARPEAAPGFVAGLSELVGSAGDDIMRGLASLADAPRLLSMAAARLADPEARRNGGRLLLHLIGILAAGWTAERLALAALERTRRSLLPKPGAAMLTRLALGLAHLLIELAPVAGFAAAALFALGAFSLTRDVRQAALMVIVAWAGLRLVLVLAEMLAAPRQKALRLLPVDDETAEYLLIWTRRFATVGLLGWLAAETAPLAGLPRPATVLALKGIGLAVAAMAEVFILQNRAPVAAFFRRVTPEDCPRLHTTFERLAQLWHGLAVAYVAAVYLVWAVPLGGGPGFMLRATALTLAILAMAMVSTSLVDRAIDRAFAVSQEVRDRFPGLEARANRYLPALRLFFRLAVLAVVPLALLQAWGVQSFAWVASDLGRRIVGAAISIAATLAGAVVVWELVSGAIERGMANGTGRAQRSARMRTLLPLTRSALLVFLTGMVSLMVLSQLGVNIAPLLAGAGVVGIAVGFGSQKLVQDVITGAFILFEDTLSVGDVIKLDATHSGVVESMSIRAIRLRDTQGSVHTIPFSAVGTVINMTRDFAYAVFDLGIGYREDVDRVIQVLRDLAAEMRADPDWAERVLEPLDVLGLDRFESSAVVVRVRLKTPPTKQWDVQREFNRRIKRRFDEQGIEIPFPQSKVWLAKEPEAVGPA